MSEKHESLPPQNKQIEETVPFKDGVVTISANTDRLRADFLAQAKKYPNVNLEKASKVADSLPVFLNYEKGLGYIFSDLEKVVNGPIDNAIFKVQKTLNTDKIMTSMGSAGFTYANSDCPAICLNPKFMAEFIGTQNNNYSKEVQEKSLIDAIYTTWCHERDHAIRLLDPHYKEKAVKDATLSLATAVIANGTLTLMSSVYLLPELINHPALLVVTNCLMFPTTYMITNRLWYMTISDHEKLARKNSQTIDTLPNIFDFTFENEKSTLPY